jgi:uncharacterized coiled-coil DUF342 family protein
MNMNEELRKVSILRAERDRLLERVARLTAERDEARREVCYASTKPPRECAEERGWDCWDRKDFCDKL